MRATSLSPRRRARLSQDRRDQIVREHVALVKAIAIRVHENLPLHVDLDDLIHAGVMGLFDAVIKYDNSKNVAFHAYAKHRIEVRSSIAWVNWTGPRAICASGRSRWNRSRATSPPNSAARRTKPRRPARWAST